MRFQLTKIVEDRSPVVVSEALERCLKSEAWEIKRYDQQVVALGIGTSRSRVNLADKAIFQIDSSAGATTVQVEAEYQFTWFLSEESQNDTVRTRFESVFANMRAHLNLAPEFVEQPSEPDQPPAPASAPAPAPAPASASITASEISLPATEAVLLPTVEEPPVSTQETAVSAFESSIAPAPQPLSTSFLQSSDVPHRPRFAAAPLIAASLIAVLGLGFGFAHFERRPLTADASQPAPSVPTPTQQPLAPTGQHPATIDPLPPRNSRPPAVVAPASLPASQSGSQPAARSQDLRRWLEEWAASERTRDARTQASFYADDVRPYLTLDQATRDAVYQQKQNSIQNRNGLWTFKIENIYIKKENAEEASVLLKKLVMTQTDSVLVSERRVSSFLTLKRKQDGWQITGERDLGHPDSRQ